jgi:hypothetical protein
MLTTGVKDTDCKLFTGVNDTGGNLAPVSMTSVVNNGVHIRWPTPDIEHLGKNQSFRVLNK